MRARRFPRFDPSPRRASRADAAGDRPVDLAFLSAALGRLFAFLELVVVEVAFRLGFGRSLFTELRRVLVGDRLEKHRAARRTRRRRRRVVGLRVLLIRPALRTDRLGLAEVVELRVTVEALV